MDTDKARIRTPPRRPPVDPVLRERDAKMESLKRVVGKLAHDFNNYLAAQIGYTSLIRDEGPQNGNAAEYAAAMEKAAQQTERSIDTILMAVKPERRFFPMMMDFSEVATLAIEGWKQSSSKPDNITVRTHLNPVLSMADEQHWAKLFSHLLSNAEFALEEGGNIDLQISRQSLSGEEMLRLGIGQNEVCCIQVQDSGEGMPEETAQKAFEPFFTTRASNKLSGLGLTLVHSVAHLYGGQVELFSRPGVGTRISLYIPVIGDESAKITTPPTLPGLRKALLMEKDPLMKEVLGNWLSRAGSEVMVVETPTEAASALGEPNLEILVAELSLAGEAAAEITQKAGERKIRVLWIAGEEAQASALEPFLPELLILRKPFTFKEFNDLLQRRLAATDGDVA